MALDETTVNSKLSNLNDRVNILEGMTPVDIARQVDGLRNEVRGIAPTNTNPPISPIVTVIDQTKLTKINTDMTSLGARVTVLEQKVAAIEAKLVSINLPLSVK